MTNHATNTVGTAPTLDELDTLSDRELKEVVAARLADGMLRAFPHKLNPEQRQWLLGSLLEPSETRLRERTRDIQSDAGLSWPTRVWMIERAATGAALGHGPVVIFFPLFGQQFIYQMGLHIVGARFGTWATLHTDGSVAELRQYGPIAGVINILFRLHAAWVRWRTRARWLVKQGQGLWRRTLSK